MNSTSKQPHYPFKQKLTWLLRKRRKRSDSGHHTTNWSVTMKPTVSSAAVDQDDNVISPVPPPPPTPPAMHHHHPPCYPRSIASSTTTSSSSSMHSRRRSLSLRSACSGISNLSARVQHFHIGTPASYFPKPESIASLQRSQRPSQREAHLSVPSIRSTTSETTTTRSWRRRRERLLLAIDQQSLPDFETQAFCSTCEKYVQSRIRYRTGALTWLIAFILFLCTVFLFWVPFYVKYFKDVVHYCPACSSKLGTHLKL
ncbi:hypothetical protein K492DRAFT_210146 [Lichtheimia hyalospora FSU 10163]|nr:hypothetical protein K492DRAFT_210146 [Lichtheimia hyalospora FSU 10163]